MKKLNLNHPFHLTSISPWPLFCSLSIMFIMINMMKLFSNTFNLYYMMLSIILFKMCTYQWWRDVCRESFSQGMHNSKVINGMKLGMILFIISEIFFFISFFWTYFHMFLSPSIEIGNKWPPFKSNYILINPYSLPMINTILLVSSGMFLSMAHYLMIKKIYNKMTLMMEWTIIFGIIFTWIQIYEYCNSMSSINSSIYGSLFFVMTGFHGIHVIVGTIFIITTYKRMKNFELSNIHHFGFEASAWYWHFVDVIWLFLFLFIYWWPF